MGQGVGTGLGHGGITCVLQTQFSSFFFFFTDVPRSWSFIDLCISLKLNCKIYYDVNYMKKLDLYQTAALGAV